MTETLDTIDNTNVTPVNAVPQPLILPPPPSGGNVTYDFVISPATSGPWETIYRAAMQSVSSISVTFNPNSTQAQRQQEYVVLRVAISYAAKTAGWKFVDNVITTNPNPDPNVTVNHTMSADSLVQTFTVKAVATTDSETMDYQLVAQLANVQYTQPDPMLIIKR